MTTPKVLIGFHSRFGVHSAPRAAAVFMALAALVLLAAPAVAASRYGELALGPGRVLFVAEESGGRILALEPPEERPAASQPFNLNDLGTRLAAALGTDETRLRVRDLAVRPGSGIAYLSGYVADREERGFVAAVGADGAVRAVNVATATRGELRLSDQPAEDLAFWGETKAASLTVTDMLFHGGRLYVAGLSNRRFASTLRTFAYPFGADAKTSTVEIYHTVHNQIETRAPIRTMTIIDVNGAPHLLAAYTCTPLALIPLSALTDGAHVRGKTIAELGYGNTPVDLLAFDVAFPGQPTRRMVVVTGTDRGADVIPFEAVAKAAAGAGLDKPVQVPLQVAAGVPSAPAPLGTVLQLADEDTERLLALRRDRESGALELVSIRKGLYFRLSDFVNEYDFPDYAYPAGDAFQQRYIRPVHGLMKRDEGKAAFTK